MTPLPPNPQGLCAASILDVCSKDDRVSFVDQIYSYNLYAGEFLEGMPHLEEQCLVNPQKYSRETNPIERGSFLGIDGSL